MEGGSCFVPANVAHEMTSSLLTQTWDAWLFGEPGAARSAIEPVRQRWSAESLVRAW